MAVNVGTLEAVLALKDQMSPALAQANENVGKFESTFGISAASVVGAAGAITAAVGSVGAALVALGVRGSDVADVSEQFMALNARIGNTGDVVGSLRTAFAGTVSDFDIMKATNLALSQGLKLTTDQMTLTAQTARVLADRTGGDAAQAYQALNMAMATGMDRGLKMIGLNIDATAATERYAASIGAEVKDLTEAQTIEAKRIAILESMRNELNLTGEAGIDFADRVAQAKSAVQNLYDVTALVTTRVLIDLADQFGDVGVSAQNVTTVVGQALNVIGNGLMNLASIGTNAIKNLALAVQSGVSTIVANANIMKDVLTGKTGLKEGLSAIATTGASGLKAIEDAIRATLNPTLQWKDYVTMAGSATAGLGKRLLDTGRAASSSADDLKKWKEQAGPRLDEILGIDKMRNTTADWINTLAAVPGAVRPIFASLQNVATLAPKIGVALKESFKGAFERLPDVVLGALQGGGNVGQAVGSMFGGEIGKGLKKSLGDALTKGLGSTIGGAIGSFLPGLGSILGSGVGKLVDKVFKKEEMQVNDLRDSFIAAHGGWLNLQRDIAKASNQDLLKKLFDAKTVDQYNAALKQIQDTLGAHDEAQQKLNAAIEKYGFTIEELGPKFAQQKLDEQAASLFEEYQLLSKAGVDHNAIISRMGPAFNEYVQSAIAAGGTIPEAMRPAIEALIENGQLLDANGNAYTSVEEAGVKFAKTQAEMFDTLIEKIDKMVSALLGIPSSVSTTVTTQYVTTGGGGGGGPIEAASGFEGWVTRPTPFMIGEGGQPEYVSVTPRSQMGSGGASAASASGPVSITVPVNLAGVGTLGTLLIQKTRSGHWQVDQAGVRARG